MVAEGEYMRLVMPPHELGGVSINVNTSVTRSSGVLRQKPIPCHVQGLISRKLQIMSLITSGIKAFRWKSHACTSIQTNNKKQLPTNSLELQLSRLIAIIQILNVKFEVLAFNVRSIVKF